jgi:Transposase DDE domain
LQGGSAGHREHWSQHNFHAYGAKLGNACPPDGSLTGHPRPEISLFNRTESVPPGPAAHVMSVVPAIYDDLSWGIVRPSPGACADLAGRSELLPTTGKRRQSAIDGRTTRHKGYGLSQSCRAMIECIFGWGKQHGTMRKTKHRGITKVTADFMLNLIAYNLIRIPKLLTA